MSSNRTDKPRSLIKCLPPHLRRPYNSSHCQYLPPVDFSSSFDVSTSIPAFLLLNRVHGNKSLSSNRSRALWLACVVRNTTWGDCAEQCHDLWIVNIGAIRFLLFGVRLNRLLAMVLLHRLMLLTHLLLLFRQGSPFLRNLLVVVNHALIRRAFLHLLCAKLDV